MTLQEFRNKRRAADAVQKQVLQNSIGDVLLYCTPELRMVTLRHLVCNGMIKHKCTVRIGYDNYIMYSKDGRLYTVYTRADGSDEIKYLGSFNIN